MKIVSQFKSLRTPEHNEHSRVQTIVVMLALACCTLLAGRAAACETSGTGFSASWRLPLGDAQIWNYNDLGAISRDAETPGCEWAAMYFLTQKLNSGLDAGAFNGWNDSFLIAHIFGAANRIGAAGWAQKDLDLALIRVANRYATTSDATMYNGCSKWSSNMCLDEIAGAAGAAAWIGLYEQRRSTPGPRPSPDGTTMPANSYTYWLDTADSRIRQFFGDVCIQKSTGSTLVCDGTTADLTAGTAKTISVNHGSEMPHYGFGMLAHIASADIALRGAGRTFDYTDFRPIAKGLFGEAQRHVTGSGGGATYNSDCRVVNGSIISSQLINCARTDGYTPTMLSLYTFYTGRIGATVPSEGSYDSSYLVGGNFTLGDNTFLNGFSYGRYVAYADHGLSWVWYDPNTKWLPVDNNNPIGYFDTIDTDGRARGWTCDPDFFSGVNYVGIVASGTTVMTVPANVVAEPAVGAACGNAGTAHRFVTDPLPTWTKGQPITAYGLDYTWYGFTALIGSGRTW